MTHRRCSGESLAIRFAGTRGPVAVYMRKADAAIAQQLIEARGDEDIRPLHVVAPAVVRRRGFCGTPLASNGRRRTFA